MAPPRSLAELKKAYQPEPLERQSEDKLAWFRDAKFGMFLHWGLYSLLGRGEWVMFMERLPRDDYALLADRFTCDGYNPREWARTARQAGMKYMVLTARHHDGFALWDSQASTFTSTRSAAKRDLVAEYVEACRAEGLKVGLYYSPMDWRFEGYFFPDMYLDSALAMRDQCHRQLEELMTNYGKIDLLWFDGEWLAHGGISYDHDEGWFREKAFLKDPLTFDVNYFWQSEAMIRKIRSWQPDIVVNNRFGWEGDFHVRERKIGSMRTDKPWDSNDCPAVSWGYMPGKPLLSLRQLVRNLTDINVRDGNYLLNLGPMGDGALEPRQVERLREVGRWLEQYGSTLYGTRGGPVLAGNWGGTTYRANQVHVHVTEWRENEITLDLGERRIVNAESPTSARFDVRTTKGVTTLSVPSEHRHPLDTIVTLTLDAPVVWSGVRGRDDAVYGLGDGLER